MLFSIIIPTYNNANFLKKTLESIENQTDDNYELIIIDNHSTDETKSIIENSKINRLIYKKIKNDGVIAKSRNLGIQNSKGDWLMFLDSDDLFYDNKINFLNNNLSDEYDLVCNSEKNINLDNNSTKICRYGPYEKNFYEKMILDGNKFSTSASTIKKDFILKNKVYFNERYDFVTAEDYDFFLNLVNKGAKVKFYNQILGDHSFYDGSQSSNYKLHKNSIKNVLNFHVYNVQNFEKNKKKLWNKLKWRFLILDFFNSLKKKEYSLSIKYLFYSLFKSPLKVTAFFFKTILKKIELL